MYFLFIGQIILILVLSGNRIIKMLCKNLRKNKNIEENKHNCQYIDSEDNVEIRRKISELCHSNSKPCLELLFYLDDFKEEKIIVEAIDNHQYSFSCDSLIGKDKVNEKYIVTYKTHKTKSRGQSRYLDFTKLDMLHDNTYDTLKEVKDYIENRNSLLLQKAEINKLYDTDGNIVCILKDNNDKFIDISKSEYDKLVKVNAAQKDVYYRIHT